ncbi:ketosynthase chain-length factor [Streptomyces thermodiastaticus]|jgi:act minimal PKS chain-length factor (CLF/KS beta)|uniref:ketosynthase chain-length factor n=1 Tax=Streptomyces thermodiastaticus TaxID=44061 RepID=UPI00167C1F2C|nr:ketosynthase chain-length factor [Streptomyces thermodiastaticus]MCE7549830.1 ketosynthase chain-length factor [Streptomyces thermodiastaticus]GHF65819.1 actinorhodin polyketide putative beta-ketoacyl synthase 2 [Streptomyces thermodiastaticus]
MTPTAVITGLGVIAPNGVGTEQFWSATLRAETGIRPLERFDPEPYPARLAGQVADEAFDPRAHLPGRLLPQTDRMTRMALAAADWALADAGVDPRDGDGFDRGVITASASGGYEFGQRELQNLWSKGPEHVSAYQSFAWFYAVNTGQISIRNGMRGPSGVVVGEQAGGLDALGQARRAIRGGTPLIVSGAVDSALNPWGWIAHLSTNRISTRECADEAYLPFSPRACGHVPGEGGAILVVEEAGAVRRRGGRCYGVVAGYAAGFDPVPGSGRPPALRRVVERALADAGVAPGEVDAVFADAAGSPDLDEREAEAIRAVFGPMGVPVCAPKALTGRLNSGGAPLDVVAALLSMRDGVLPPAGPVDRAREDYGIDLVTGGPRPHRVRTACVLARGTGGFTSALVLTAADDRVTGGAPAGDR